MTRALSTGFRRVLLEGAFSERFLDVFAGRSNWALQGKY